MCKGVRERASKRARERAREREQERERERESVCVCVYVCVCVCDVYDLVPKGVHARGYALQLKIKHC